MRQHTTSCSGWPPVSRQAVAAATKGVALGWAHLDQGVADLSVGGDGIRPFGVQSAGFGCGGAGAQPAAASAST
jgi:hypothetical protein